VSCGPSQPSSELTAVILLPDASGDWQVNYIAAYLWSRFVSDYGAPPTALDMGEKEKVLSATYVAVYNSLIYAQEFI
jgi:hypothetical protein